MTDLKKILVIDEIINDDGVYRIDMLKKKIKDLAIYSKIEFAVSPKSPTKYVLEIDGGNDYEFLFAKDDFFCIIIHHSIDEPSLSSNFIDNLKDFVGTERLIIFSGERSTNYSIKELKREHFYNNHFLRFCLFAERVRKWFLPALFYDDYERIFIENLIEELISSIEDDGVLNTVVTDNMVILLDLLGYSIEKQQNILKDYTDTKLIDWLFDESSNL